MFITKLQKILGITLLLWSCIVGDASAQEIWTSMEGPSSTGAIEIEIDPHDPDVMYVVGSSGFDDGLYKSTNAGLDWLKISMPNYTSMKMAVEIDPYDSQRIYCGKALSTNGGQSWFPMSDLWISTVSALAVDPVDSNNLYAGDYVNQGIWKSTDYGLSWEAINEGINLNPIFDPVYDIVVNPQNPSTLIAMVGLGGNYKSTNCGDSWECYDCPVVGFTYDWSDTSIVYGISSEGLMKSSDSGDTWFSTNLDSVMCLTIDPLDPETIYAAGERVYKSIDGGQSWLDLNFSSQGNTVSALTTIAVSSGNPQRIYVGDSHSIFWKDVGSPEWYRYQNGYGSVPVCYDVSMTQGQLYAGTTSGVYRFIDDHWVLRGGTDGFNFCQSVMAHPHHPSLLLHWYGDGMQADLLFRSTDAGFNWYVVNSAYIASTYICYAPSDPDRIYAHNFRSSDAGENWETFDIPVEYVRSFAVHPFDRNTVYIVGDSPVYKSIDSGDSWSVFAFENSNNEKLIVTDSENEDLIYVLVRDEGIYRTENGGSDWEAINEGLGCLTFRDMIVHPVYHDQLYLATHNCGIYFSDNRGESWTYFGEGLPGGAIRSLVADSTTVYAGTGYGVFKRDAVIPNAVSPDPEPQQVTTNIVNYPNPFTNQTAIQFHLSAPGIVTMRIFDVSGALVNTVSQDFPNSGDQLMDWNGRNTEGNRVSSGMYFYEVQADGLALKGKMVFLNR